MTTYSVGEIAERFRVGTHTVLGWIHAGELPAINVNRAGARRPRWRITEEALRSFEAARTARTAPAPRRRPRRKSDPNVIEFY